MKTTKRNIMKPIVLGTLCSISTLAGIANAEVIFDNFNYTPGEDLYGFIGNGINQNIPGGIPAFANGQSFVVDGGDYTLDTLIAPIVYNAFNGGLNEGLTLSVYTNGGDGLPDTLLESATYSGLAGFIPGEFSVNTFEFAGTTVLEDGARYWITATVPDNGNIYDFSWIWNADFSLVAPTVTSQDGGPWLGGANDTIFLPQGAFRVEGSLVPAPGVLTVFATLGLVGTRRRRD